MKTKPTIHHGDFVYVRMKGIIWSSEGLGYPYAIRDEAGKALANIIQTEETDKALIINCQGVVNVDDHALDPIMQITNTTRRKILFTNINQIETILSKYIGHPISTYHYPDNFCVTIYGKNGGIDQAEARQLTQASINYEKEYIKRLVKNCFIKFDKMKTLSSTPILATGIFNARQLISDPNTFIHICLNMAEKLDEIVQEKKIPKGRLFAVSLRGSPLASAISLLSGKERGIEIVDHLGPKNKIVEEYSLENTSYGTSFIYIGDFIIGGTELKIAKAYACAKGCTIDAAIVIGCVLNPKSYSTSTEIIPLVRLAECCPDAKYTFEEAK